MRSIYTALLMLLLSFCVCLSAAAEEELIDKIVAVVNGEVITLSELRRAAAPMIASFEQGNKDKEGSIDKEAQIKELVKKILEQLVEKKLIEQEAKKTDIKVTDRDVEKAFEDVLKRNKVTLAQLQEVLKQEKTTLAEYKKYLRSEILQSKLIGREVRSRVTITDKDVQDYYEKQVKAREKTGERVHIQQIFLATPPGISTAQASKLNKQLEELRGKIVAGGDFAELAAKYSQDTSASEGGDMGFFHKGELLPPIEQAAFAMEKGEVSQVIRTPAGFHLLKLLDKQSSDKEKGWKARREEIEDSLYRQEVDTMYEKWVEGLKKNAYIKIYL